MIGDAAHMSMPSLYYGGCLCIGEPASNIFLTTTWLFGISPSAPMCGAVELGAAATAAAVAAADIIR